MPVATGTASGYFDVLTQLRDFLVANGWVQIGGKASGNIDADTDFVSFKGIGLAGDDEILVTMQPFSLAANNAYSIRVKGHTAYTNPGVDQPGADSLWCYLLTLNSPVTYWFIVNERRFIVVLKSGSRYDAMYAGFILPEHLPSDWSYPLYIGASANTGTIAQSSDVGYHTNFWHPIAYNGGANANNDNPSNAFLFSPIQAWVPVRNGYTSSGSDTQVSFGRVTIPWSRICRQNVRRLLDDQPWFRKGQIASLGDNINVPEGGSFYGSFDGVYYTPAFGATAEQESTVAGVTYKMFPNIGRTSDGHFAAMAME